MPQQQQPSSPDSRAASLEEEAEEEGEEGEEEEEEERKRNLQGHFFAYNATWLDEDLDPLICPWIRDRRYLNH